MRSTLFWLPVVFLCMLLVTTTGICDAISNIRLQPNSISELPFGTDVTISFDYQTDEAAGVRIFIRPMTEGVLTQGYAAGSSPLYAQGTGSGNATFTINSGEVTVDQLQFRMLTDDQSTLLLEFFIPVLYVFRSSASSIFNINLTPASPAALAHGKPIEVAFDYDNQEKNEVRIFVRPFTNGSLTPNYAAGGSLPYTPGNGSTNTAFTIGSGETRIHQLEFEMYNTDQSVLLLRFLIPVDYRLPADFTSVPGAPTLNVMINGAEANLSWEPVPTADGYTLLYAPHPGVEYINTLDMKARTEIVFNLITGFTDYFVAVAAYNENGNSTISNIERVAFP